MFGAPGITTTHALAGSDGNGVPVSNTECAFAEVNGGWDTKDATLGDNVGIVLSNDARTSASWRATTTGARLAKVDWWR